jgi:hypothetical protein
MQENNLPNPRIRFPVLVESLAGYIDRFATPWLELLPKKDVDVEDLSWEANPKMHARIAELFAHAFTVAMSGTEARGVMLSVDQYIGRFEKHLDIGAFQDAIDMHLKNRPKDLSNPYIYGGAE